MFSEPKQAPLRVAIVGGGKPYLFALSEDSLTLLSNIPAFPVGIAGLCAAYGVLKAQREGANVKLDVYEGAVRPLLVVFYSSDRSVLSRLLLSALAAQVCRDRSWSGLWVRFISGSSNLQVGDRGLRNELMSPSSSLALLVLAWARPNAQRALRMLQAGDVIDRTAGTAEETDDPDTW
jgi:hypothetical protein